MNFQLRFLAYARCMKLFRLFVVGVVQYKLLWYSTLVHVLCSRVMWSTTVVCNLQHSKFECRLVVASGRSNVASTRIIGWTLARNLGLRETYEYYER